MVKHTIGMGLIRVKVYGEVEAVYHCMSRVVSGERWLQNSAKEVLRRQMWRVSDFCGVEVLTYCIMSNHIHLLIRVPAKQEVSDEELLRRVLVLYGDDQGSIEVLARMLQEDGEDAQAWRKLMLSRMGDVSMYMKMLKQRFSIWYNRSHQRLGTLWADRFKSVLVEDMNFAVEIVAAYIDLNAVRGGLCRDPGSYRFCGYAEAMAGSHFSRRGISSFTHIDEWQRAMNGYRMALFGKGAMPKAGGQPYLDRIKVKHILASGGKVSLAELLRCRVRYFTEGAILGSADFVQEHFERLRHQLGPNRKSGPRQMKGADWGGLTVLRDLQKEVIS